MCSNRNTLGKRGIIKRSENARSSFIVQKSWCREKLQERHHDGGFLGFVSSIVTGIATGTLIGVVKGAVMGLYTGFVSAVFYTNLIIKMDAFSASGWIGLYVLEII